MALNDNARYAYQYYIDKWKLKPHQAAGIVGNLMQESGLNTGARNAGDGRDGSDSIGVAQWNGARARGLHSFAQNRGTSTGDLNTQLDYVMHEMMNGGEGTAYKNLMNAQDVAGATSAFIGFERPQGWSADNPTGGHGYTNRLRYAGLVAGLSPDEIAAAQPSSAMLDVQAQAKAEPDDRGFGQKLFDRLLGSETPAQAEASILPKILPDEFMGVNTKKGLNLLGALGSSMTESSNTANQQIQAAAQAGQARRGAAQPVELALMSSSPDAKQNVPGGISSLANLPPQELLELLKKQKQLGGLGGLGGWRI